MRLAAQFTAILTPTPGARVCMPNISAINTKLRPPHVQENNSTKDAERITYTTWVG